MKNTNIIHVTTTKHADFINITNQIQTLIPTNFNGICHLFCLHTTAALTINENADPNVIHDLLLELERITPWHNPKYLHAEGNSSAHLKASMMGFDLTIPVTDGLLTLGTWQSIYLTEFDGPRTRKIIIKLISGEK